jgi:spore coat protein U-like protein
MHSMWPPRLAACSVAALALFGHAEGQTFTVSAEIVPGCIVSGSSQTSGIPFGSLAFGLHPATWNGSAYASASTGVGAVELECTAGVTLTMTVDGGLHASAGSRHLAASGASPIPYALYADSGLVTAIPMTGSVGVVVPPSGVIDVPIHGVAQMPGASQAPGVYADTLNVTFSW